VTDRAGLHDDTSLNLKQVAAELGVHYMTAYRYVRQGRLDARRLGTEWRVDREALHQFRRGESAPIDLAGTHWTDRFVEVLLAGDEPGAWSLVGGALAAGRDPAFCYLDMIGSAIAIVDARFIAGELSAADLPLATAVATRVAARLGARFRRPGRSRGSVVLGAPLGERHSLPIAIVADLVRIEGFDVLELGAEVEPAAFAAAALRARRLVAIGLGVTSIDNLAAARQSIIAVRAVASSTPIVIGGQAVLNSETASVLEADGWAPDGRSAVAMIASFAPTR
jgi:excisionase family DNA binding protein